MSTPNTEKTFFQERLEPLGVTDENNTMRIKDPLAEAPAPSVYDVKIFTERQGNIEIMFWTLDREMITYVQTSDAKMGDVNGKPKRYVQTRLKEPKGDRKYLLPSSKWLVAEGMDATYPWLPPEIVEAYEQQEQVPVLFLTEGVFKAWMATKSGIPTIGLTSITHYANRNGELHQDIQRIILRCKVEQVVVLWDADCLNISEHALTRREDLIKRPLGFYASAKKIRQLIHEIDYPEEEQGPAVYFYHVVQEAYKTKPKGLDDLLICGARHTDLPAIAKQALETNKASVYFKKFDITDTTKSLHEYFCLKDADRFYSRHSHIIKASEFKYNGDLMRYHTDREELVLIAPGWANPLRWIGDEFFMEIDVPSARPGETRKELKPFNQGTLEKLYRPKFWKYLDPFMGFCNVPDHFHYKQVIDNKDKQFYNRYFPFKHVPEKGSWDLILQFVKHIFGEEEVTHGVTGKTFKRFELGLDYIQILLQNPTQRLPVLILYSPENNTGKSTFGDLLTAIFGDNAIPLANSDLQSDFNEPYADKLLAICEETLLDRKKDVERIKNFSTSLRIQVNPKGSKQYGIDFFCKFIFMSNNARMIYVTRHDERFWIIRVPMITTAKDPELMRKMKAQIPAFIHHLKDRQLASPFESRMHFHASLLHTDTFDETVKINEPTAVSDMREELANMFMQDKDLQVIEMPLKEIRETFFQKATSTGWLKEVLRDYLLVEQLKNSKGKAKVKRGEFPLWERNQEGELYKKTIKWRGRPYLFHRADFLTDIDPEDYKEMEEQERKELAATMVVPPKEAVPAKRLKDKHPDDLPF